MKRYVIGLVTISLSSVIWAQPLRSDKGWAIHPQKTEADWQALTRGDNLVLGKLVTAQPAPNYQYTGSDLKQLTDGVLAGAEGRMWTDKRAVGWAYHEYVRLVLDLGQPQPVSRVLLRLQIIGKDNTLPRLTNLALSLEGDYYFPVRSLAEKVHPEDNPALSFEPLPTDPPGIYAISLDAGYRARYVRLDFTTHGILVCDEIAVMAATGAVGEIPPAPPGKREYFDNVFAYHLGRMGPGVAAGLRASRPMAADERHAWLARKVGVA